MISYGLLNKIEKDNISFMFDIRRFIKINNYIIKLKTFKLIDIHLGGCKDREVNIRLFIRYAN